ncbi:MAG: dephospho-CoA kinase [Actinomycetota bacterium]|nr:dephospho-CoA kinase [Actinomycetota bacterium]
MLAVGLTGGIGSGKSTVAQRLVEHGAVLVDADRIAREVVAPGGPAYQPLVDRFGREVLAADGTLDRARLAAVVFADPQALADLNAITHPAVGAVMAERRYGPHPADAVVVLDIPLLRAEHRAALALDLVVVVDCPVEVALDRLVTGRAMPAEDARARIAAQVTREERRAEADVVIDNDGDLAALGVAVDRLWEDLAGRAASGASAG